MYMQSCGSKRLEMLTKPFLLESEMAPVKLFSEAMQGLGNVSVVRPFFKLSYGAMFESPSTHHYWALSKSFLPSSMVIPVTKK